MPPPDGHEVGVAPDQRDVIHRDAGLIGGDHRPRGVVALPVRRRAGVDEGRAVVLHLDLGGLAHVADAAGDLDVHADADAEQLGVARLAAACLLGAEVGVAGGFERLVERAFVVADVVGLTDRGRVRFEELRDQVDAAHLGGIHADLGGEHVHRPLGRGGGLGSTGTSVRRRSAWCW